jgi:hypothetical protein
MLQSNELFLGRIAMLAFSATLYNEVMTMPASPGPLTQVRSACIGHQHTCVQTQLENRDPALPSSVILSGHEGWTHTHQRVACAIPYCSVLCCSWQLCFTLGLDLLIGNAYQQCWHQWQQLGCSLHTSGECKRAPMRMRMRSIEAVLWSG